MTRLNSCEEAITSDEYVDIIIETDYINIETELEDFGAACFQKLTDDTAVFHIKTGNIDACLDYLKKIPTDFAPNLYGIQGERSIAAAGIQEVFENKALDLNGSGVIIGIIDTGIEYSHEAFIYEDKTSKILSIWDQSGTGNPLDGFLFGSEYTNKQINEAINADDPLTVVPEIDEDGHGTFVAGIAAGRPNRKEKFIGAAPDADLIIVKLKEAKKCLKELFLLKSGATAYQTNDILLGANYILKKAKEYNRPVVILFSGASNLGPHTGNVFLERTFAKYGRKAGVVMVLAAGNEGNTAHHYRGHFNNEEQKEVLFNISEKERGILFGIWNKIPDQYSVQLISPTRKTTGKIPFVIGRKEIVEFIFEGTEVLVEYTVDYRTADQITVVRLKDPTPGVWTLVVNGDIIIYGEFDIWLPIENFIEKETVFLEPDPYITVVNPANNTETITIGAYNDVTKAIYLPSSKGYNRNDQVKPDIVAPGVNVSGPYLKNSYGVMSGSSVAAAITAGAGALLLEWGIIKENNTTMDTMAVKTYLIIGARRREPLYYPNREWGYGELDLFNTFTSL